MIIVTQISKFEIKHREKRDNIKLSHKMVLFTGLLRERDVLVILEVALLVTVLTIRALEDAKSRENPASSSVPLVLGGSTGCVGDDERLGEGLGGRVDDAVGYLVCVD